MAVMYWHGAAPKLIDETSYKWMEARFVFFLLIAEAVNTIFFGCEF